MSKCDKCGKEKEFCLTLCFDCSRELDVKARKEIKSVNVAKAKKLVARFEQYVDYTEREMRYLKEQIKEIKKELKD